MALKLLNPGLRPLGMFDLDDADSGALVGGEFVELTDDDPATEAYAADVAQLMRGGNTLSMKRDSSTAGRLGGLADEGGEQGEGYGTLFGSLIGANAGQATQQSGAVVIGPSTDRASGKVTVWATPGLYGVTDQTDSLEPAVSNAALFGTANTGLLTTTTVDDQVAVYVGAMSDTSLVSTTNSAAGLDAETEYHAVFLIGVQVA